MNKYYIRLISSVTYAVQLTLPLLFCFIQLSIENDEPIPSDAHVHDVAGLFKLFFRELPDPLITGKLADALMKCCQLSNAQERWYAMRLLCLTLPSLHLYTLQYMLQFLNKVAANAESNKMDASNLALVMMPNLMGSFRTEKSSTAATDRFLKLQTFVVRHLIENADAIGVVPDAVMEKVASFGNRSSDFLDRLTSEDELDKSTEATLDDRKKNRRRRRSGPIQGMTKIHIQLLSRKYCSANMYMLSKIICDPGRGNVHYMTIWLVTNFC